jgi:high-affinity Fe2+/Pb2+ permease
MSFAFFFAAGSFFLGQQKVMPQSMHGAWYLTVLALAPLAVMAFWLIRIRFGQRFKSSATPVTA